ncbi:glycosyltransferase [Azospirillum sp.]|uniref:glycosyltransferase n=1 Tax=Azospirillum sp. TaxID=34012 RepID=UPI002D6759DA|nr:glycosyltransferase [Azospirillum sp.]HYD70561.1 glycosyltransferase [Azospirillum sp.]
MIPKILHQLWKDADVPERFGHFRETWRRHHPDWQHRLWTDADLHAFVAREFPDFLPVYEAYAEPIRRVDAARYLILKRYGGLYADLDFECLKPIDPLLDGHTFAIGLEPESHLALEKAAVRGMTRILCPSLIASVPGHPFWDHVVEQLRRHAHEADVLDATGPFLLTRALDGFADPGSVTLLPSHLVYPADKVDCWEGRLFDIRTWERLTRDACALHHWDATWVPGLVRGDGRPAELRIMVTEGDAAPPPAPDAPPPLVSCLMATRDRPAQALLAIDGFRRQTYANRELVIVDDGADDGGGGGGRLARAVAALGDPRIRLVRPQDPATNLGRARNRAVDLAAGTYVCQWDDDDLYDPLRLELQMAVLRHSGARACLLSRWMVWWPEAERLAISRQRPWEGSLLCEKAVLPRYPELARGEDTPVVERLLRTVRVVHLDEPRLYLYVVHGANTFPAGHFDEQWQAADPRWEGERAQAVATELAKRLPLAAYGRALAERTAQHLDAQARAAGAERRWADALALWDRALAGAPWHWPVRLARGLALLDLGRFEEAEADFTRVIAQPPGMAAGLEALAGAAARRRDWPAALRRWQRLSCAAPASPEAIVGLVTTLVELGRLDEAEALARRRTPVLGRAEAVVARAAVLQRRQDGAELAALLDANADVAAANPTLRALHFHTLQARGEMARARAAVQAGDQAADGGGGSPVLNDLLQVAFTADGADAAGRRRLHALWRAHGAAILSPDLLGLTAQAVREAEGDAGLRALLDAVDALPPVDARAVKLRLLAVFERLRGGLDAGTAEDALRRLADAQDRQAPMGHWAQALRRFADGFDRLRERFPAFLVDSGWRRASAEAVADRIIAAHRAGRPFSLVRLGDGEGNFLPYPAGQEAHAGPDRDATQRIWWGAARLEGAAADAMTAALARAVRNADVVGVPDLSRLCYGLPLPTPPFLFHSWHDYRGLLAILDHLGRQGSGGGEGALFAPGQTITSCHIHADLAAWGQYERLFAAVGRVSLVTCHPALPDALARRFGVAIGQLYRIPHEAKYAAQFGYADAGDHYPHAFRALERTLAVRAPGEVFLVAAGFLGKMYCDWIKDRGGIALDVGSVVDHWCGFATRSLHFTQRYAAAPEPAATPGVNLFGHVGAGVGLGVAARGTVAALKAAGIPHAVFDLDADPDAPAGAEPADPPHGVNIIHTNPDFLFQALASGRGGLTPQALRGRVNIGVWAWESATSFPAGWEKAFALFHEVWAPSRFTAEALRRLSPVPVAVVPHVVEPHVVELGPPAVTRAQLGLPEDAFVVAFLFDELSGFSRKNPLGAIAAFRQAFPRNDGRAALVIKARTLSAENRARLEAAAGGSPAILLRVGDTPREEALGLISACDAYLSLHRAEGFGLTVAEAMALGKPVVATAWSGVLDFLAADCAVPVPCTPVTLTEPDGYYPAGTVWAEPDLDAAARALRALFDDRVAARRMGERAAARIRATLGAGVVGARVRDRLAALTVDKALLPLREKGWDEGSLRPEGGKESFSGSPSRNTPHPNPSPSRGEGLQAIAPAAVPAPSVLVLTPVKNARRHLPAFLAMLERLDHPRDRLSLGFLEGDSDDGSHAFLEAELPRLRGLFRRVVLMKHDLGVRLDGPRWAPAVQRPRRAAIAKARNRLLNAALADEEWVLWVDADVLDAPPDALRRLLAVGGDIVVPHCVLEPGGPTFDLNSFRITDPDGEARHMVDGLVQPPRGVGRRYLDNLRGQGPVPLDSVGGTMLLVRADLHREGLIFPPFPYRGYIETEGLAMMARDMGITCWGLPDLEIVHARD